MVTSLDRLPAGRIAVVVGLQGGRGMMRRLDALGLRPGKRIRQLSSQFMAGPITILVDGRQVAMGRGIAARVQVRMVG
ncbi:MAG: ferrous iron transport protein A [Candidatus Brocadiae bacterium]|nr:ferrous iron transport protein A [Candidatus Brocadiia bacterium]